MKSLILCLSLSLLSVVCPVLAAEKTEIPKTTKSTTKPTAEQPTLRTPVPLNYWVHFDPKTADTSLAAYGEFFNVSSKNMYLTAVENDDFEQVELHALDKAGNDYQPSIDVVFILPSMGGSVKLAYGGNYVLLRKPKKTIVNDSETTLTLHYRVEGSEEEIVQNLLFPITSNGIGCSIMPASE